MTEIPRQEILTLDRFEIESAGQNPAKLAYAIHKQLGLRKGAVPVVDIAYALDIKFIEAKPYPGCEGVLLAHPNKSRGVIGVHSDAGPARRRFTIAHELGHFVHPTHKPLSPSGSAAEASFMCSALDIRTKAPHGRAKLTPYQKQEMQANQFAAELLMPVYKLRPYLKRAPNLERVLEIASALKVSREAAANRYVEIHDDPIAIIFSRDQRVRYIAKAKDFLARTTLWNGDPMPLEAQAAPHGCSDIDDADPDVWLSAPKAQALTLQTLRQRSGYQMNLLMLTSDDDDDIGFERSDERFSRF